MALSEQLSEAMREVPWDDVKRAKENLATALSVKSHEVSSNVFSNETQVSGPGKKGDVSKVKKAFPGSKVVWSNERIHVSLRAS